MHNQYQIFPYGNMGINNERACAENPAFRFFGRRLYVDQSLAEFLNELLMIMFSTKRLTLNAVKQSLDSIFPDTLQENCKIEYSPRARLNLKLFAFWTASRLDIRPKAHKEHFEELRSLIKNHLETQLDEKEPIIKDLEKLFFGLRAVGDDREWCAQQFLPLCRELLTRESIWPHKLQSDDWHEALRNFSYSRALFMAHGGDVLYCQLCLAFQQTQEDIEQWNREAQLGLTVDDCNSDLLRSKLEKELPRILDTSPSLSLLARFIDSLETSTADVTERRSGEQSFQTLGWCAKASWKEAYLFAVDLQRIASANIDIIERIALLETACALQILRTLAARSSEIYFNNKQCWPGYFLPVTAIEEKDSRLRTFSNEIYEKIIYILNTIFQNDTEALNKLKGKDSPKKHLEELSRKYGSTLFNKIGKKDLKIIIPARGGHERFVLTERVLKLLVLTIVPAGKSLRLDTFKERAKTRYGFVFDAKGFSEAFHWLRQAKGDNTGQDTEWLSSQPYSLFPANCDSWLQDMLEDANLLVHLSDACSLVHNPVSCIS